MSDRTLKQLVGALFVVVMLWGVATLFSRSGGGSIDATGDIAVVFDGVDESSLSAVRMIRPLDTLELLPVDGTWTVNGWPSDSGNVARFFDALAELQVGDLSATNPANHARMGISADSARILELHVGDGTRTLLIGDQGPRFSTQYARLPGEDEVYLLEGALRSHMTRQLDDWRNRRMLVIDTSRVSRLEIERDEDAFTLVRGDSAWTFEDGGSTDSGQVRSVLGELAGGLIASRFVAEGDSIGALPRGGSTVAMSETGEVLAEVTVGTGTNDRWATVAGDSVVYRLASFRVNLITPTLESVQPDS